MRKNRQSPKRIIIAHAAKKVGWKCINLKAAKPLSGKDLKGMPEKLDTNRK